MLQILLRFIISRNVGSDRAFIPRRIFIRSSFHSDAVSKEEHVRTQSLHLRTDTARILNILVWAIVCLVCLSGSAIAQEAANNQPPRAQTSPKDDDIDQLRKMVRQLSAEVGRLRAEVAKLEKYQKIDYLRDQIRKEEQRAEGLQKELSDIAAKETSLQKRLDEIEPQLRQDRIEQSLAGVGSTRPEENRDAVRTQLSNEKRRIQAQLDQFRLNRALLQSSISSAEASITRFRQRLAEAVR